MLHIMQQGKYTINIENMAFKVYTNRYCKLAVEQKEGGSHKFNIYIVLIVLSLWFFLSFFLIFKKNFYI